MANATRKGYRSRLIEPPFLGALRAALCNTIVFVENVIGAGVGLDRNPLVRAQYADAALSQLVVRIGGAEYVTRNKPVALLPFHLSVGAGAKLHPVEALTPTVEHLMSA
jgi:hypothetical protein